MKRSAGILLYRRADAGLEVFLAHPGGPFWARRDDGAWTIPKGEIEATEDPLDTAKREFEEETGVRLDGTFTSLGEIRQKGGKLVLAWVLERDLDATSIRSNKVSMEWPRGSGRTIEFPEVDRCAWFTIETARTKINPAQVAFLERLIDRSDPGTRDA